MDAKEKDCFICKKHRHLLDFTGEIIAESSGLVLTHFPKVDDELTTKGHLIIEPRRHITDFTELSASEAHAFGGMLKSAVGCIKSHFGADHVYLFRLNDKVAHLHFHLIPRYPHTPNEFRGLKIWQWPDRETLTLAQIHEVARALKARISFVD